MNHGGRGLLGDAPHLSAAPSTYSYGQQPSQQAVQATNQPQINEYQQMALTALFSNPPPPPNTQTPPPPPPPPQQQHQHPGMGLLGDSPQVVAPPPLNPNIAALAAAAATRAMFQQQQQQQQQQNVPLKTVTPTIQSRSQHPKQNRTMLIQQFRKLREVKGRVIILQFKQAASDEQVLQIGNHFGRLKNYLNVKQKAWVEYFEHEVAMAAMERIADHEMLHLDEPIEVSTSSWSEIKRKDGRDLWRSDPKYQEPEQQQQQPRKRKFDEPCLDSSQSQPYSPKVARTDSSSDSSFRPRETSSRKCDVIDLDTGEDDTADRIANSISMALKNLRKVEDGQVRMESGAANQAQVDAIEIVSILGKIKRDQEQLNRAKSTLVTDLAL